MKKFILTLLGISFASVAFARGYHRPYTPPAPVPAPTPAPVSGMCINYGHDVTTYDLTANGQVAQDLAKLKAAGITCLRLAYTSWTSPQTQALALFSESKGFSVIMGGNWWLNGPTLTASEVGSYESQVLAGAQWAQTNGIHQYSIGNEQESYLSGISVKQWASDLQTICLAVRRVYSGKISYEMNSQYLSQYISAGGVPCLTYFGLNLYGGYQYNLATAQQAMAAFGTSHVYISETNCDVSNPSTGCADDATHAAEVKNDAVKLLSLGIPEYFFTFRGGADDVATNWGIITEPLTAAAIGIK